MLLALKLILVPALVLVVSVAGRRWGSRVAGLLTSLPIVSGPALLFFAVEQGDRFAAEASRAVLVTIVAVATSTVVYAWLSVRMPWWLSLPGSCAAFAAMSALLERFHWHVLPALAAAVASVTLARVVLPSMHGTESEPARPAWDFPLRAVSAVAVVLFVTALAPRLGPTFSGVLAAFPIALIIVLAFTHAQQGPPTAIRFLRGFIPGMWSATAFCSVIALAVGPLGKFVAFPLALLAVVIVQATMLWALVPGASAYRAAAAAAREPSRR